MAFQSAFRFQARGRVASIFRDPADADKCRARVLVEGGVFSFYGKRGRALIETMPDEGEEVLVSGSVVPTGESNRIGQPLYTLEVESVGPSAKR